MNMTAGRRALDKVYRRRDRYEIPDWQRERVWDDAKKQQLIDSILRGWKLPKFYFVKVSEDEYEVVDGQQRLTAIFEFFAGELELDPESRARFGGPRYKELATKVADAFDDFELEFDEIEDATDEELKAFFQRLQQGLPLTSSEKLNAVHSKLRDFCKKVATHPFFTTSVAAANTRYAHFDIIAKATAVEIEGIDTGLRFDDLKDIFEAQQNFSSTSAVAKRIRQALDYLHAAFPSRSEHLKSRAFVQSAITLACKLVATGRASGTEADLKSFLETFAKDLKREVELGQTATDSDYLVYQRSVNANVKGGARTRNEVLLRKLLVGSRALADILDPSVVAESGLRLRVRELARSVVAIVATLNDSHSAATGRDLFKATNRTARALGRLDRPVGDLEGYREMIDDLYFLFWEGPGNRLDPMPQSFSDVNALRTYLRHDADHGGGGKVRSKRRQLGGVFEKYAGDGTPETVDPTKFLQIQAGLLTAIEADLKALAARGKSEDKA